MMDTFRKRLERRDLLIGTLFTLPSTEIAEILSEAGFDWLWIDEGARSVGISRAHGYGMKFQDYVDHAGKNIIVIPQIEHILMFSISCGFLVEVYLFPKYYC